MKDGRRITAGLALGVMAALLSLVLGAPAQADSGRGTIYKTTSAGGSPASYVLTVNATDDVTVGDHLFAYTSTSSGVWEVTAKTATTITVREDLTEENGAVAFGAPSATAPRNLFAFATPGANDLTRIPDSSIGYASAALRRNAYLTQVTSNPVTAHNMLSATHSDSTASSVTRGALITGQGSTPAYAKLALGSSGHVLRSDGTDAGWAAITTSMLPTIELAGGGTGATTAANARAALGVVPGTDVQAYSSLLAAIAAAAATKGNLIVGNGSTWTVLTVGANGQALIADSAQASGLTWSSAGGGGSHQLLSATHPDTTSATVVRGDLITGQSGPTWNRLAIGPSGRYVRSDGTDVTWGVLNMDDASSGTLVISRGGTGATDAAGARTALDVQQLDADLTAIAALTHTSGYVIKSNGSAWTASAPSFLDSILAITDEADTSKVAVFQASGINTATTRTYALPNASGTLALTSDITATGDFLDTVFRVHDQADATKLVALETSGITTGTTRTLTVPDASGTIALTATTQPLDAQLTDVAAVTPSANQFLGGDGANLVMRTAAQVKTSLAIDHGADVTGLGDDDHTQYVLLAGRSGGQIVYGGTGAVDGISIRSTAHATKGHVTLGQSGTAYVQVDESTPRIKTEVQSSSASAILAAIRHEVRSPGAGAGDTGFGHATDVYLYNSAGSTPVQASRESFAWTDATASSEDTTYTLGLMRAGTMTDAIVVNSLGQITTGEWQGTTVAVSKGGTGATDAAGARTALDVQQLDAQLTDVAAVSATANQFLGGNGSNLVMRTAAQTRTSLGLEVDPATAGGRLTASSTAPVTTSDTTSATLYYLPYTSEYVAVHDGTSWVLEDITSSGISLDVSALTIDQTYDVYVDGTPALSAVAWGSHTAGTGERDTSTGKPYPIRLDGAWVQNAATTKRYLGTIRTVSSTGTKCLDTSSQRLIWNVQNQVARQSVASYTSNWTYTTATYREAAGLTTVGTTRVEIVVGLGDDLVEASVTMGGENGGGTVSVAVGVGVSSVTTNSAQIVDAAYTTAAVPRYFNVSAHYMGAPGAGFHFIQWLEWSTASATTTWYGNVGSGPGVQGLIVRTNQ